MHRPAQKLSQASAPSETTRHTLRFFRWARETALKPSHLIVLSVSLLLHLLGVTSVLARQHGSASASIISSQDYQSREFCVFPEETCAEGNCSPPIRAGLFDSTDMKTLMGEVHIWRQETMMYLTVKTNAPYRIPTYAPDHMRLYVGAHLPKNSHAQFVDTLRVINREVPCATITLNLETVCLPGCMYHPATDECQCAAAHHGSTRAHAASQDQIEDSEVNTADLFHRGSIYMSLSLKLTMPRGKRNHPKGVKAVSTTMHTIQWDNIRESHCRANNHSCMPTLQLHSWGAVLEWRNPDRHTPVPRVIAEFHQRQGLLHRHVPHFKIVPGVSPHSVVRKGVNMYLLESLSTDQTVRSGLFAAFGSHKDDNDDDDRF